MTSEVDNEDAVDKVLQAFTTVHVLVSARTHARTHAHTHAHINTHALTHTCTHTHSQGLDLPTS